MHMDLAKLLALSVQHKASDLHLSAGMAPMIRVDGEVQALPSAPSAPLQHKQVHQLVYDIMTDRQRKDYTEYFECDFAMEIKNLARFRVNAFCTDRGAAAVFRIIPEQIYSLSRLAAPEILSHIPKLERGLVIVTGPTGSGKSTTLAALVEQINQTRCDHILTIEDPIEFIHQPNKAIINQREVHSHTLNFQQALRAALRQDPDVILIGEMRDLETVRLALTAAETGHLVLATLHTGSAPQAIDRIIEVFPAAEQGLVRSMLSATLQAVIAQTLVKKVTGGRIAVYEIMLGIPAINHLIRENKVSHMHNVMQTGGAFGMQTMEQGLQRLEAEGLISREILAAYKTSSVNQFHPS